MSKMTIMLFLCIICNLSWAQPKKDVLQTKTDTVIVKKVLVYKDSLYEQLVQLKAENEAIKTRIGDFYTHNSIVIACILTLAGLFAYIATRIIRKDANREVDDIIQNVNSRLNQYESEFQQRVTGFEKKAVELLQRTSGVNFEQSQNIREDFNRKSDDQTEKGN